MQRIKGGQHFLRSSLFILSSNFEAIRKILRLVDSSGTFLFLKLSRSSRNRSIDSSYLFFFFSNLINAWSRFIPEQKRFNSLSKVLSAVSRSFSFFPTTQFSSVPSRLLSIALQSCCHHSNYLALDVASLPRPSCLCSGPNRLYFVLVS